MLFKYNTPSQSKEESQERMKTMLEMATPEERLVIASKTFRTRSGGRPSARTQDEIFDELKSTDRDTSRYEELRQEAHDARDRDFWLDHLLKSFGIIPNILVTPAMPKQERVQ